MKDVHTSVGAYVSDALESLERDDFEAHLAECELCRQEVAEFDETLAEFSRLAATAPPSVLRDRVLAGITDVRPLPPESLVDRQAAPAAITAIRPQSLKRTTELDWDRPPGELAERRHWRRTWILTAAVAAMLVMAVGLGGWVHALVRSEQAMTTEQSLAAADVQRERELLTAPDARVISRNAGGAQYSFVVSQVRNEALFLGTNLADPGPGKAYQLWTLEGKTVKPDDVVAGSGRVEAWLTNDIRTATNLAVSVEPESGSATPTEIKALVDL